MITKQQALRVYEYLTRSREKVLEKIRALSDEQYSREFSIGMGSLSRTLAHIVSSEWYYMQRMLGGEVPAYETWPIRPEDPPVFRELEAAWRRSTRCDASSSSGTRSGASSCTSGPLGLP